MLAVITVVVVVVMLVVVFVVVVSWTPIALRSSVADIGLGTRSVMAIFFCCV